MAPVPWFQVKLKKTGKPRTRVPGKNWARAACPVLIRTLNSAFKIQGRSGSRRRIESGKEAAEPKGRLTGLIPEPPFKGTHYPEESGRTPAMNGYPLGLPLGVDSDRVRLSPPGRMLVFAPKFARWGSAY